VPIPRALSICRTVIDDAYPDWLLHFVSSGARDYTFADASQLWTSGYDMPSKAFMDSIEELWEQISPLFKQLHCHVRAKLSQTYGKKAVPVGMDSVSWRSC